MKIGELARAAETNVSTIKFYVKEGLIQAACKTGPNMAYYHPDCISRVQLIKSLQKERYYPLSVIKQMLDASNPDRMELELLDAIYKVDYKLSSKTFSLSEAAKMTRLSREQISALLTHRLVNPDVFGKKQIYAEADLQVMFLIRRRMDGGIPFEQSVDSFVIYEKALRSAAEADVDSLINHALVARSPSAEEAIRMISVSDETLDRFVSLKRTLLNREFGAKRIRDLDSFSFGLSAMLNDIGDCFAGIGQNEPAEQCRAAALISPDRVDPVSIALSLYNLVITRTSGSLVKSISAIGQAHAYFLLQTPEGEEGMNSLLLYILRMGWLCMAPSVLDCAAEAQSAVSGFSAFAFNCIGEASKAFVPQVTSAITHIAEMRE